MKVEEKFNRRAAPLIDCQPAVVDAGAGLALGVRVRIYPGNESGGVMDGRTLSMHLTPDEALEFAQNLVAAARERIRKG